MSNTAYIVIPATGSDCFDLASAFKASAAQHDWNCEINILSDQAGGDTHVEAEGYPSELMVGFIRYVPATHEGPVILMDSDMLAVGSEPCWVENRIGGVAKHSGGVVHTPQELTPRSGTLVDGMILVFDSYKRASGFCEVWSREFSRDDDQGVPNLELLSLWRAASKVEVCALEGDHQEPYRGKLKHLNRTRNKHER